MRCSTCGNDNPQGMKFCGNCAAALKSRCARCGFDNPPAFKFCGECAAPLGAGSGSGAANRPPFAGQAGSTVRINPEQPAGNAIEGERKTVTALFADIKGSTEMMEDLDPEQARDVIDPALKLMMDSAHRYDGYVVQSTGDGIFALFGAPVAHEDHPQRALYAALKMQEELRRYSAKVVADCGTPIQGRVGINTGEVVVRSIQTGAGHIEYTPIGHMTNLASRMQTAAPVGSIAVTEATRKLCEGYFILKPLGPTRVKGVTEPVNVYEVTGLGPLRTRLQRSAGRGLTKFVGRDREMAAMRDASERAKSGHGQIVAAIAEAGTGKSRLLFEFKAKHQSGWMVLEAFSVSHGKASAYLPVLDLLHTYFKITSDDDARTRREKVTGRVLALDRSLEDALPYLFALLGIVEGEDPIAQMDGQIKKRRTLDAIKRILPLIVIFEDLHWIDEQTQEFLILLADSIANAKLLLLVNYRPEYSHQWGSKTYYTQLRLDPLGKESADEMLTALLGDNPALAALKRTIIERTEGNPFFMEETYQVLLDEGALIRDGATVRLTKPISELKIPPTVQGILASRIDRLPGDAKDLLQTLSVIGRQFATSLIRAVVSKSSEELDRMLNDLQLGEFIYEQPAVGDTEYVFKHALTQEVAYNSVLMERRKQLHERIGDALETLDASSLDDHLSQLAHHYGRSSNTEKAIEYLERAGQQSGMRGALIEAELFFEQAIATLTTMPETPARIDREFNLQYAFWQVLQYGRGVGSNDPVSAIRRLQELSEKTGNSEQRIAALRAAWLWNYGQGRVVVASQIAQELIETAQRSGSRYGLTLAHFDHGLVSYSRGELLQALQHFEATIASYNQTDWSGSFLQPDASALAMIGIVLWHLGRTDQGRAKIREAISTAERVTAPGRAFTLQYVCNFYNLVREPENVRENADRLQSLISELQLGAYRYTVFRGWTMAEQGRTDEGIALIREAIDFSTFTPMSNLSLRLLSAAQARAGQLEDAFATVEQAFAEVGEQQLDLPAVLWWRGELHLKRGDGTLADRDFRETRAVARSMGSKAYELRATTSLARLLRDTNRREEARAMLADIYNWFTEGFDTADLKDAKALLEELS
jgi:class 3 adenylate cyclase/tetratricopeptide (TPR) repeat protein